MTGLKDGVLALFPEREIFLRSGGKVKFVHISTRLQLAAAAIVGAVLLGWAAATLFMLFHQADMASERAALDRQSRAVAGKASAVNAYRKSVGELAEDLEARQEFLDELYKSHFGAQPDADAVVGAAEEKGDDKLEEQARKIGALAPEARPLLRIELRQRQFARLLTGAVQRRTEKAEAAIRGFGLDPRALARAASAQGGPFIPWKGDRNGLGDELKALSSALARLDLLERTLVAIPSGQPTATPMLSSSYGYRRDPFNGSAAFHAGIDFPGRYGQPILAAARGKISYVGQRQGYGNVIEITHGNGLMTRYAHLAGFNARIGQSVSRGDAIGRMGSTGRSTGTHLHFEVRMNDAAINPRRFLEARKDVLEIQQIAKERFADIGNRG